MTLWANCWDSLGGDFGIAEEATPTIECIWSEEVGAPRAGYVKHHEIEPLAIVESDLMVVKQIKSFQL